MLSNSLKVLRSGRKAAALRVSSSTYKIGCGYGQLSCRPARIPPQIQSVQRRRIPSQRQVVWMSTTTTEYPTHEVVGMPALSPTMETGTIARWLKNEGEEIGAGEVICEVETDKATVEFEAQDEGVLAKILSPEGTADIPVGQSICIIVEDSADVAAFRNYEASDDSAGPSSAAEESQAAPAGSSPLQPSYTPTTAEVAASPESPSVSIPTDSSRIFASPFARKIARESGVEINNISGTGPNGRIIASDVKEALEGGVATSTASTDAAAAISGQDATVGAYDDTLVTDAHYALASQLTIQKQTVPHYHLSAEVCLDELLDARTRLNGTLPESEQLSVNDFLVRAATAATRHVPDVNTAWMGTFIRQFHATHVNVIMSNSAGMTVAPVLRNSNALGLHDISSALRDLSHRIEEGGLQAEDLVGGTFTVCNVGMYGVKSLASIVSPQQSCALGLGTIERIVVPNEASDGGEMYKYSTRINATLACDHRTVDGAVGAKFLSAFKKLVENPLQMLL